jgi:hypothetical protein
MVSGLAGKPSGLSMLASETLHSNAAADDAAMTAATPRAAKAVRPEKFILLLSH